MTFTIKIRGAAHPTELADYECPVHGRFEARVMRPAPDTTPCPVPGFCSECSGNGYPSVRSALFSPTDANPCKCGGDGFDRDRPCSRAASWRISAPGAVRIATQMVQGKVAEYPQAEYVMDTRPLADGMPLAEFKAQRAKVHRDIALREMRRMTGR